MDDSSGPVRPSDKTPGALQWRCEACGLVQEPRDGLCAACGALHAELEKSAPPRRSLLDSGYEAPSVSRAERVNLLIEVTVVVLVSWGGSWFSGFLSLLWPRHSSAADAFWPNYLWRGFGVVQDVALVLFVIRKSGEPWAHFGISRFRPVRDVVGAVCAYAAEYAAHWTYAILLGYLLAHLFPPPSHEEIRRFIPSPTTGVQWVIVVPIIFLMAFSEEIVMRGYLIPRLESILGSTGEAVLLSALLFGLGHGYQGLHGIVGTALFGLVYGAVFAITRRLWPLVIGHAALNIWLLAT